MQFIIFEDEKINGLQPLNLLKGCFDINVGIYSIFDSIYNRYGKKHTFTVICRQELEEYQKQIKPDVNVNDISVEETLFINGRVHLTNLKEVVKKLPSDTVLFENDDLIFAKLSKNNVLNFKNEFNKKNHIELIRKLSLNVIESLDFAETYIKYENCWDTVRYFKEMLNIQLTELLKQKRKNRKKKEKKINASDKNNIYIGKKVKTSPEVVIENTDTFVYIDDEAMIEPFTYITGPVYIGKKATVKAGSKIYGPCSIGYMAKVSGEISHSIFNPYSNKQHDGFAGHSYISEFVNLGADTVTSNLKNNYSKIKIKKGDHKIDSDMQFLGSIIGEHTKTGINTMLNTGTIIGIFANIAGGGFPDKEIGSFSWHISGRDLERYRLKDSIETAKIVMARRGIQMTKEYENLVTHVYNTFGK